MLRRIKQFKNCLLTKKPPRVLSAVVSFRWEMYTVGQWIYSIVLTKGSGNDNAVRERRSPTVPLKPVDLRPHRTKSLFGSFKSGGIVTVNEIINLLAKAKAASFRFRLNSFA